MASLLITGGTGSFGHALTRIALQDNRYERICIYSRDEHKHDKMSKIYSDKRMRYFIGDIRDVDRLTLAMRSVHHVVHAAALKIVPLAEYNPLEYVKTNIQGAANVIQAAETACVTKVLALSTDKAVRPINLYGATKLCAEKMFAAANNMYGLHGPMYSTVRYGNVAGSNGSVIPVFRKLLAEGKPLTVTHCEMTRFWITLDDAARFVYAKLGTMEGGETFIPPMPSFKVIDLAHALAYTQPGIGNRIIMPGENLYPIEITGIRPGEKLHEDISDELSSDSNDKWLTCGNLIELLQENAL